MTVNLDNKRIAVIGLGYVGLPLAVEFAKHWLVVGYDRNNARITARSIVSGAGTTASTKAIASRSSAFKSNPKPVLVCKCITIGLNIG